jgi:PAS domain S-box-containing protein
MNQPIDDLKSENIFQSVAENSHAGIFIIDSLFHVTYANNRLLEIVGYTPPEIIGKDFRLIVDDESRKSIEERYSHHLRGENLPARFEFHFIRKDGQKRCAELNSALYRDSRGNLYTVGQILDVTERKNVAQELRKAHDELEVRVQQRTFELQRANILLQQEIEKHQKTQKALLQSESKYRHLIENANSIILEMDPQGHVIFINKFAQDLFGYREQEILGRSVVGTIVPARDTAGMDLERMIEDIVRHPENYLHNENENMLRNGERVWIVWTNQPIYDEVNKLKEILCIGINRTSQKKAEELLSQQLTEKAAIEERTRLARDLHDAVSQTLFSASIIAEVLPRLWERNPEEGKKRLEEIRQLTRGALAEMRTLLLELRPSALADTEMNDLIKQLAESITGRTRIPVAVEMKGHCASSPEVKVALYRIAQEALNNVAKHSGATQARVSLDCLPDGVELSISDNGKGFDVNKIPTNSLGLGIMHERAREIGAFLDIKSKISSGTEIMVVWKMKSVEEK